MLRISASISLFLIFLNYGSAHAEQDCSKTLLLNTKDMTSKEQTRLSLAWNLTESVYDSEKRGHDGEAVIYGFPMKGSFKEFKDNIKKRAEALNLVQFVDRSFSYSTSSLGETSLKAYLGCLTSQGGLRVAAQSLEGDFYKVMIYSQPYPDAASKLRGSLYGAKNILKDDKAKLADRLREIDFSKSTSNSIPLTPIDYFKSAYISVKVGSRIETVVLPPILALPPPPSRTLALLDIEIIPEMSSIQKVAFDQKHQVLGSQFRTIYASVTRSAKGIVAYKLDGSFQTFTSVIGMSEYQPACTNRGRVLFSVYDATSKPDRLIGNKMYASYPNYKDRLPGEDDRRINLDINGVKILKLVMEDANYHEGVCSSGVWGEPTVDTKPILLAPAILKSPELNRPQKPL